MLLILYGTLGLLLSAVGFKYDSWQFWCFLGLFWSVRHTARFEGRAEAAEIIAQAMRRLGMDIEKLYKELSK
jgi:hypothetical protein